MTGTRYKKRNPKDTEEWLYKNWQNIILYLFLCGGVAVGAVLLRDGAADALGGLDGYFSGFLETRRDADFLAKVTSAFTSCLPFYLGTVLLSLSLPGTFLIPFLTLFRAMGIGLTVGYFYRFYGGQGMGYALLILLPHLLISTLVLLYSAGEGMRFSLRISRQILSAEGKSESGGTLLRPFLLRQGLLLLFLMLSSLLDACIGLCFDRLFVL